MFPILSDPSSLLLNLMLLTPVVAVPGEPHTSDHLLLLLFIGFCFLLVAAQLLVALRLLATTIRAVLAEHKTCVTPSADPPGVTQKTKI